MLAALDIRLFPYRCPIYMPPRSVGRRLILIILFQWKYLRVIFMV